MANEMDPRVKAREQRRKARAEARAKLEKQITEAKQAAADAGATHYPVWVRNPSGEGGRYKLHPIGDGEVVTVAGPTREKAAAQIGPVMAAYNRRSEARAERAAEKTVKAAETDRSAVQNLIAEFSGKKQQTAKPNEQQADKKGDQ